MRVFLIGYRGAGKTTVAERLARRLGWDWIDADDVVESQAGQSIAAIFASQGEAGFRALESAAIADLATRERLVIGLGGGAILAEENRRRLRPAGAENSVAVWLTGSPEQLWSRISGDASTAARRPNLTPGGGINEIIAMLERRAPLYRECAQLVVDTDDKSPDQVAEEILAQLPFRS